MRVTSSMYYDNLYGSNNSKLSNKLFDVNKQISSGLKIQYAQDNITTFTETMKLDNEMATLGQIKKSTESGQKVSNQTDIILNEFDSTLTRTRTLLLQASNSSQSVSSMDAIAAELRGLESHFKNLANTSINGQFLFSGSAVNTKPIADDGTYMGNDKTLNAFLGSNVEQAYNMSGAELFLGEEPLVQKKITTNVTQYSLSDLYPDGNDPDVEGIETVITPSSKISDLMGDTPLANTGTSHFYINGVQSGGTAFKEHIVMSGDESVDALLTKIGKAFGNSPSLDLVNVTMNDFGQIVVEDKMSGSSKLDFHMVGAIDFDTSDGNDAANVNDAIYSTVGQITNLDDGETSFEAIVKGYSEVGNPNLYVKNFVQSPYETTITPSSELISAEYVMDRAVDGDGAGTGNDDELTITINDVNGIPTTYSQFFILPDAAATYDALKNQIEADNDFIVAIDSVTNTVTLNSTPQGMANSVYVVPPGLENDNSSGTGVVNIDEVVVNSMVSAEIDGLIYDRTQFTHDGAKLTSNISQILKSDNAFASPSTKLSEVADITNGTPLDLSDDTLDGTQFNLSGTSVLGLGHDYSVVIDLKSTLNGGSTFSLDTDNDGVYDNGTYNIFNVETPRAAVDADKITYQQLMDVMNMVVTNQLPLSDITSGDAVQEAIHYDSAIKSSQYIGNSKLTYDGKIEFEETGATDTKATISLYDSNAGNFNAEASVMTFNSNNTLTISDSKTDFFKSLNEIITAVEEHKLYPDSTNGMSRNIGMENAIDMLDDMQLHLSRSHATVGANSNTLFASYERASLLEMSTMTLRSSVIDTDLAEASLELAQLNLNYQAMLSTVAKVSQLSLVNYL